MVSTSEGSFVSNAKSMILFSLKSAVRALIVSSWVPPLYLTLTPLLTPLIAKYKPSAIAPSPIPSRAFFHRPKSSGSSGSAARNSVIGLCNAGTLSIKFANRASLPSNTVKSLKAPAVAAFVSSNILGLRWKYFAAPKALPIRPATCNPLNAGIKPTTN